MSTLPEYKVLTASDVRTLEEYVTEHLAHGWELAGGIAHTIAADGLRLEPWWQRWSQAVVRHPTWPE